MSFQFTQQGSRAAIVHQDQEIIRLDSYVNYNGGQFWVADQCMVPGGEPEVASIPVFAFYGYRCAVNEGAYEVREAGPEGLTVVITPANTQGGRRVFDQVQERCTLSVRLVEGRYVWRQQLDINFLQAVDTADLDQQSPCASIVSPTRTAGPGSSTSSPIHCLAVPPGRRCR